jgi:DNA-binding CsgD family transcriptional regulator
MYSPAWLEVSGGEKIQLADRCTLGRHPDNNVVLLSERVSGWHAVIIRLTSSEFRVMDLDTKNGTRVNGDRIFESHPLRSDDTITVGGMACRFVAQPRPTRNVVPDLQSTMSDTFDNMIGAEIFDPVGYGVMVLDDDRPTAMTESASDFLIHYFPSLQAPVTELPSSLLEWLDESRDVLGDPALVGTIKPFRMDRGDSRLTVRVKADLSSRQTVLIFLDERPLFTIEQLKAEFKERYRLTPRESEVLYYVALGKTSPEVATILAMGERTVSKHLENVFPKLFVENRQSAIVLVFDYFKRLRAERG